MASNKTSYILTKDDLNYWEHKDPPQIRAAQNPDPRDNARRRQDGRHTYHLLETPLLAAIKTQLPENVHTLLSRGVDPNGLPLSAISAYASFFLRFRDLSNLASVPSEEVFKRIVALQSGLITVSEIEARRKTICVFWRCAKSLSLNHYKGGDGVTALEEACKHASAGILQMILSSSPDISFWSRSSSQTEVPNPITLSSLSVSNPLLCAIQNGHNHHLQRLLDFGFNPNSMPLACRQQCYSPAMATLMCDLPNWDAFSLLLAHPATDQSLLTPVTKAHVLHFAVAALSLSTLRRVLDSGFNLSGVAPTALGHTLLHIACLPLNITHVNIFQESIYSSAHEFRQISPLRTQTYILFDAETPQPQPTDFCAAQAELVHYLFSQSPNLDSFLAAQDCHGNTALHYLAMHRTINQELLESLMGMSEKAEDIYYDVQNHWGWNGENLVRHGEVARTDIRKSFWITSHAARVVEGGAVVAY